MVAEQGAVGRHAGIVVVRVIVWKWFVVGDRQREFLLLLRQWSEAW